MHEFETARSCLRHTGTAKAYSCTAKKKPPPTTAAAGRGERLTDILRARGERLTDHRESLLFVHWARHHHQHLSLLNPVPVALTLELVHLLTPLVGAADQHRVVKEHAIDIPPGWAVT